MFCYEPPLNPPSEQPDFIAQKIQNICEKISQKGEKAGFPAIFNLLYEHIQDNIEKFLPEADYDNYI